MNCIHSIFQIFLICLPWITSDELKLCISNPAYHDDFRRFLCDIQLVPDWQLVPSQSSAQLQLYRASRFMQLPPFLQGKLRHSSISAKKAIGWKILQIFPKQRSLLLTEDGVYFPKMSSDAELWRFLWCQPGQTVVQTVETSALRCLGAHLISPLIARFMGPTWDPSGADRTQVGLMLAHELCYLGLLRIMCSGDWSHFVDGLNLDLTCITVNAGVSRWACAVICIQHHILADGPRWARVADAGWKEVMGQWTYVES